MHKARPVLKSFGVGELNRPGNEPWPQPHPTPLGWFGTDWARSCCQTSVPGLSNALVAVLGKKLPACTSQKMMRKSFPEEERLLKQHYEMLNEMCNVLVSAYFWTRWIKLMLLINIKQASKWMWPAALQDSNATKYNRWVMSKGIN